MLRTIRAEGLTELIADLVLICGGGNPASPFLVNLQLFANANITSRVLPGDLRETLLLMTSGSTVDTFFGQAVVDSTGATRQNSVIFTNVPFVPPPAASPPRVLRFTNIRINANGLAAATPATLFLSVSPPWRTTSRCGSSDYLPVTSRRTRRVFRPKIFLRSSSV